MAFDLETLNSEQIKPVLQTTGPVLVTAGAGSGKTRLLTHRVAHLINDLKVPAYNILAITFTNKAANEMKERLSELDTGSDGLWVSTFHSMCVSIMRRYVSEIGNYSSSFSIYDEDEKMKIIKNIVGSEEDLVKNTAAIISSAKNEGIDCERISEQYKYVANIDKIAEIYAIYQKTLSENNAFDFDDLLITSYKILNTVPRAREYYQERFKYIHVDEFQDTNTIQYLLIKILADKYKNIFVVGDEDQSIYGWRGANIENIKYFISDFEPKIFKLEQNYRSTKNILKLANSLIKNNSSRIDKELWTENEDGSTPFYFVAQNEMEEAEFVVQSIMSLRRELNYSLNDFAILMRVNALSRNLEQKLIQYNIKHKIYGGFKFFERKEIKDLLAYMRVAVNNSDKEALIRIINFPKRGIGDSTIKQADNYAAINNMLLYDVLKHISDNRDLPLNIIKKLQPFSEILYKLDELKAVDDPANFLGALVEILNLREVFGEDNDENTSRKMNIAELIHTAQEFNLTHKTKDYEDFVSGSRIETFLQMVSLYSDVDEISDDDGCVNIITAHSAKGLEFKVVYIIGLEENLFPSRRAIENGNVEEERRLMYVAITRAQKKLFLTRAKSRFLYGGRKDALSSRFLLEMGLEKRIEKRNNPIVQKDFVKKPTFSVEKKPEQNNSIEQFKVGSKVKHIKFGVGEIISIEEDGRYADIRFEKAGVLTLSLRFAPIKPIKE